MKPSDKLNFSYIIIFLCPFFDGQMNTKVLAWNRFAFACFLKSMSIWCHFVIREPLGTFDQKCIIIPGVNRAIFSLFPMNLYPHNCHFRLHLKSAFIQAATCINNSKSSWFSGECVQTLNTYVPWRHLCLAKSHSNNKCFAVIPGNLPR